MNQKSYKFTKSVNTHKRPVSPLYNNNLPTISPNPAKQPSGIIKQGLNRVDGLSVAVNAKQPEEGISSGVTGIALNFELSSEGTAPDWVELLPAGDVVTGRDSRSWQKSNPQAIVDSFAANKASLPIDCEHSTEIKGVQGEEAPARGWIEKMEVREGGSIWGKVAWNKTGRVMVENREYRYLSPVILFDKNSKEIAAITSVGLTNNPNLFLPALNHEHKKAPDGLQQQESTMDLAQLLAALGLPADTTYAAALNHIHTLRADLSTARNKVETPDLDKFVPRADYDTATNKVKTLTTELDKINDAKVVAVVDGAVTAGKVTPATKDFYLDMCRQEGGLAKFEKFLEAAPVIGDGSDLDGKQVPGEETAMNASVKTVAEMFGNSADDIKKYGKA